MVVCSIQTHNIIKTIRESKNIRSKQIADALGMTVQNYYAKERGVRIITVNELLIICEELEISPHTIFDIIMIHAGNTNEIVFTNREPHEPHFS